MTKRWSGRLIKAVAVSATLVLVVSACGNDVTAGADPGAVVQSDAGPEAAKVPDAVEPGALPDEGAAKAPSVAKPSAAKPTKGSDALPTAAKPSGNLPGSPAKSGQKGAKKPGAKGAAPAVAAPEAAATGAAGTVQKLVQTAPIFGGNGVCKPATLSELAFGNLSSTSGLLGEIFLPAISALQTFVASQNACGGLNGHRIKLIFEDDQGDPSTAAAKAKRLIEKQKILAFVGNISVLTVDGSVATIKRSGVPVIGGDLVTNTWYENPTYFPQGPGVQAIAYGYTSGIKDYFKEKDAGNVWCIEVARACETVNGAFKELAAKQGINVKKDIQVSLAQPSYVQACLDFKNAGVKAIVMSMDAASDVRFARSCEQTGWFPQTLAYPLGVGSEKQFFGNDWLGETYIPMNHFPHMAGDTPATKYYQDMVQKFSGGFDTGGAASLGWNAGALLVAASALLPETNPTKENLLEALWSFKGQKFTTLGGLSPSPLTFQKGGLPKIPYCVYYGITNEKNTGWKEFNATKPSCTKELASNDPQNRA